MTDGIGQRAPLPVEPLECRQRAEETDRPDTERLLWAVLAMAGDLADIRRALSKKR